MIRNSILEEAAGAENEFVARRADALFATYQDRLHRRIDRMFALLMPAQWAVAVAVAFWPTSRGWADATGQTRLCVSAALSAGGLMTFCSVFLALRRPGKTLTRHVIAAAQLLMSALLVHLTGGSLETRFHVFGSLAFLAFYRDWRVVLTGTVVTAADDVWRGVYWHQSFYGVSSPQSRRWLAHISFIVLEDIFLIISCASGLREARSICERDAIQEDAAAKLESIVEARTMELLKENEERRRAEEDLQTANAELEQRGEERIEAFAQMNQALEKQIIEHSQAQDRLRLQTERLLALRAVDSFISSSFDLRMTLRLFLMQVSALIHADGAIITLPNANTGALKFALGVGIHMEAFSDEATTSGILERVVSERDIIHIANLRRSRMRDERIRRLKAEGFRSYYAIPLVARDETKGVLEILHREAFEPDSDASEFIETLAGQAAVAIENSALFEGLERSNRELSEAYDATILGWSKAMDLRDKETEGHCRRVTEMTENIAGVMGFSEEEMSHIRRGALLHDIGKMGIPDSILLKPGKLTEEERAIMCLHPAYAMDMLSPIKFLAPALDIPHCHHEKWDGTGYPRGLKGEEIPLAARIFAIVDVWDAMRSDRPYRKGLPDEEVRAHLLSLSGTHFDPAVLEIALPVMFPELMMQKAA